MVESELVAVGSINGVLSGKHYNCAIRAHKIVFEAMQRLRVLSFRESLSEQKAEELDSLGVTLAECAESEGMAALCVSSDVSRWRDAFNLHVRNKCEENPTFAFGQSTST